MKNSLSLKQILRPEPEGFSQSLGYISPYIPTRVILQNLSISKIWSIQYCPSLVGKIWLSVLFWQPGPNPFLLLKESRWRPIKIIKSKILTWPSGDTDFEKLLLVILFQLLIKSFLLILWTTAYFCDQTQFSIFEGLNYNSHTLMPITQILFLALS